MYAVLACCLHNFLFRYYYLLSSIFRRLNNDVIKDVPNMTQFSRAGKGQQQTAQLKGMDTLVVTTSLVSKLPATLENFRYNMTLEDEIRQKVRNFFPHLVRSFYSLPAFQMVATNQC